RKYTLRGADQARVDNVLSVQEHVVPLDGADVLEQREGLPVDDARQDERQGERASASRCCQNRISPRCVRTTASNARTFGSSPWRCKKKERHDLASSSIASRTGSRSLVA